MKKRRGGGKMERKRRDNIYDKTRQKNKPNQPQERKREREKDKEQ